MFRLISGLLLLNYLLLPFLMAAQPGNIALAADRLKEEQALSRNFLDTAAMDSNIIYRLKFFIAPETDSIHRAIVDDVSVPVNEKEKAILSVVSFMKELREKMALKKFEIFEIPEALISFKQILNALMHQQTCSDFLLYLSARQSRLMASAFWRYDAYSLLNDIAVYKQVTSAPGYLLQFLEKNPGFRFADSLILQAAAFDALKLQGYLRQNNSVLNEKIRNHPNIYIRQIVSLAGNRDASDLLPFTVLLAENRITAKEILKQRTDALKYFQLLVNTLKAELNRSPDSSFIFLNLLRNGMKEKSLAFYVNHINEMHSSPDAVRFATIKKLRLEDMYYVITGCEEELFTSSYLGLYHRLMEFFRVQPADSLFRVVQYDNFRIFMRMGANYNTLSDFINCMPYEHAAAILNRFVSGIETDTDTGLERAMDIADSFTGFSADFAIHRLIQNELDSGINRCRSASNYFGVRLYGILTELFDLIKQKDSLNKLWTFLGNHDLLERKPLLNGNNELSELVLFYGDEDGVVSFSSFMRLFIDTLKWQVSINNFWVTIRSISDEPLIIYANLPFDSKKEFDVEAQDSLMAWLDRQSTEPPILVHRGHSYHLSKTLERLQPVVKLAILGSCGGNKNILSVAGISPDAQIIVSKKTGSMLVNDPLIEVINEKLQNKNDLIWADVWEQLDARFSNYAYAKNLFNEYIPPGRNISLFVLKLFNYYR
jgi:hypothetical protein